MVRLVQAKSRFGQLSKIWGSNIPRLSQLNLNQSKSNPTFSCTEKMRKQWKVKRNLWTPLVQPRCDSLPPVQIGFIPMHFSRGKWR